MAIDPKLLVLKPVSELETVNNPTTGSLLFYDGGDKLKKTNVSDFYNAMQSAYLGIATTTTTPPATGAFWYRVYAAGTYTNFLSGGSPIVVTEGDFYDGTKYYDVTIEVKDNVATKRVNQVNNAEVFQTINSYSVDPKQIVPSEALYNDDTLAGDILKRVDKNTGENVNYRETTTWHDGSAMDEGKADGVIYIKKGTKYYKRSSAFNLNVRNFGAKGDTNSNDVGTDDTEALQKAIDAAHDLYNFAVMTGGERLGSTTVYLPPGRYKISSPLILKEGVIIKGESRKSTNIHCTNPQIAITNVAGYESNGNIISSKNNRIENLTISQGGIHLIQPWHTTLKNILVMNLFGQYNVGLEIQIPVNVSIEDFRVFNSQGTGILYKDFSGSGPSTTCYFKRVYASHCNIGFQIDGNTGAPHAIYSSSFEDIVSEYNNSGIILKGNIQHCRFANLHLEQNTRSMEIFGSVIASISDVFDDTEFGIGFYPENSENANITILNVNSNLQIMEGWSGTLNLLGHYRLPGFPSSAKINRLNVQRVWSSDVINKHDPGSMVYFTDKSIPVWFDGGSWRSADGFSGMIKRRGQTSERPAPNTVDEGFSFYDLDLKKMLYADNAGNVWRDAMGNDEPAYGVRIDNSVSNPEMTRIGNPVLHQSLPIQSLMRRCLLKADGTVNYYLDANNSTLKENGTAAVLDGTDGDVMVEIPQFYYRVDVVSGTASELWISQTNLPGFQLSEKCYISAYQATVDRTVPATPKLASVVNTTANFRGGNSNAAWDAESRTLLGRPASLISRTNARTYARNKGAAGKNSAGWNQLTYNAYKALFWLYFIEYANKNSQAPFNSALDANGYRQGGLGAGVTDLNSTKWSTFNSYNPFVPMGHTNSLGNKTGVLPFTMPAEYDSVPFTTYVPSYRGVENPFGHIWQWVDGINVKAQAADAGGHTVYFATDNPSLYQDSNYNGFREIGDSPRADGYIKSLILGQFADFVPKELGAGSTTYWTDYYYQNIPSAGEVLRGLFVGGHASYGANAGLAYSLTNNTPSSTGANIGLRLCYLP